MALQLRSGSRDAHLKALAVIVAVTLLLWHSPFAIVLYPFTLLATWFHEMGHGLAGMLVGAEFLELVILPDGSGYTITQGRVDAGGASSAFISAAGPLGPALAGGTLIVASRWKRASNVALVALAACLVASCLTVVSGVTGWVILPLFALAILALLRFGQMRHRQLALQFLGLQACISTYTNLGYLFSRGGVELGGGALSDTAQMARVLVLPYWFWGGVLTLVIAAIIAGSLWLAYRR